MYTGSVHREPQLSFAWWVATALMLYLLGIGVVGCSDSAVKPAPTMAKDGRMIFDDREYEISEAEITATLPDPYRGADRDDEEKSLVWSIGFKTKEQTVDGKAISPHVDFDSLNLKVASWHELSGITLSWSEPINDETGERYGITYVWDHLLIDKGDLRITSRKGTTFRVIATGENELGQSFSINSSATFVGVLVRASGQDSDESVRARLANCISLSNLKAGPLQIRADGKYADGMTTGTALFTPVE